MPAPSTVSTCRDENSSGDAGVHCSAPNSYTLLKKVPSGHPASSTGETMCFPTGNSTADGTDTAKMTQPAQSTTRPKEVMAVSSTNNIASNALEVDSGEETEEMDECECPFPSSTRENIAVEKWEATSLQLGWRWKWLEMQANELQKQVQSCDSKLESISKRVPSPSEYSGESLRTMGFSHIRPTKICKKVTPAKVRRPVFEGVGQHPLFSLTVPVRKPRALSSVTKEEIAGLSSTCNSKKRKISRVVSSKGEKKKSRKKAEQTALPSTDLVTTSTSSISTPASGPGSGSGSTIQVSNVKEESTSSDSAKSLLLSSSADSQNSLEQSGKSKKRARASSSSRKKKSVDNELSPTTETCMNTVQPKKQVKLEDSHGATQITKRSHKVKSEGNKEEQKSAVTSSEKKKGKSKDPATSGSVARNGKNKTTQDFPSPCQWEGGKSILGTALKRSGGPSTTRRTPTSAGMTTTPAVRMVDDRRKRKRRTSDYDIDNIVMPCPLGNPPVFTPLPKHEIWTPNWRIIDSEDESGGEVKNCGGSATSRKRKRTNFNGSTSPYRTAAASATRSVLRASDTKPQGSLSLSTPMSFVKLSASAPGDCEKSDFVLEARLASSSLGDDEFTHVEGGLLLDEESNSMEGEGGLSSDEDTSDDVYHRRHRPHEIDERKRAGLPVDENFWEKDRQNYARRSTVRATNNSSSSKNRTSKRTIRELSDQDKFMVSDCSTQEKSTDSKSSKSTHVRKQLFQASSSVNDNDDYNGRRLRKSTRRAATRPAVLKKCHWEVAQKYSSQGHAILCFKVKP